jgi:hypothetical protein
VRAQRVGINVATEGFSKFLGLAERLEQKLKQIRDHFAAINQSGRQMGGLTTGPNLFTTGTGTAGAGGGFGGGGGGGMATGGGFGNMVRGFMGGGGGMGIGGMAINRSRQQMQESIPMFAQAGLWSSMYSGANYLQIERQRIGAAGLYAGDRQGAAQAQAIGLGYGQTIAQSTRFMQGLGRQVQASGGTMNIAQAAQSGAGFLDPITMRRQQAMGMRFAREGGQVRDFNEVAMDYIRQYEKTINRGRKLNEFDFINLGTPGTNIRMMFSRLYALDDAAIDTIVRAGMQNVKAGGNLNFGSSSALAAAGFSNQQMLGLQAIATQTSYSQRNAQYGARQQDNWIGAMNVEQQIQRTMGALEDSVSGATGALIQFERALGLASAMLGGFGMMGMAGGVGGGGMRLLGGARRGAQGLATGAGGAMSASGVPLAAAATTGGATGRLGAMASNTLGRIGLLNVAGAGLGIQQAVNARDWGDVFGAAVGGGVAGSAFGVPGAVVGATVFGGAAALRSILGDSSAGEESSRADALTSGFFMTDNELIRALASEGITGTSSRSHYTSGRNRGLYDSWQIRRGSLIGQYLNTMTDAEIKKLTEIMRNSNRHEFGTSAEARTAFLNMQSFYNDPERVLKDSEWERFSQEGGGRTFTFRDFLNTMASHRSAMSGPAERYKDYFGAVADPFVFTRISTAPYNELLNQLEAQTAPPAETGDGPFALTGPTKTIFGNQLGDPSSGGGTGMQPTDSSWNGLDPRMKDRLLRLFAASGGQVYLGEGGGTRSEAQQRNMFLDRHVPDPNGSIEWNGQRWRHVKGAAAAPPGRSMHEIGLAADLDGPGVSTWLQANAAKFGLRTFADVNNEPWHVQLAELPGSRREYEKSGGGTAETAMGAGSAPTVSGGGKSRSSSGVNYSITEALKTATTTGGGLTYNGGMGLDLSALSTTPPSAGALTGQQVAQMAAQVGFQGEGLVQLLAISKRESGWNPSAFNGNTATGDQSYGLMQINMLGNLGPARRQAYGISTNEQLFDPMTNLRAAYMLSEGGTDFYHWGAYKGEENTYNTNVEEARSIVRSMGLGDGTFERVPQSQARVGGGSAMMNVNVVIQSNGDVSYDVGQLAREVRPAMERVLAEIGVKRST